jgi:outer membrane protein assembly factor BamB
MKKTLVTSFLSFLLFSCSWFESEKVSKQPVEEKKKSEIEAKIKSDEINLTINEDISDAKKFIVDYASKIPEPVLNKSWLKKGYIPAENIKLSKKPNDYTTYSIGGKPKRGFEITSIPIIAEGKIFTLGGQGELQARKLEDPSKLLWEKVVEEEYLQEKRKDYDWLDDLESVIKDKDEFLGGNICYSSGTVFVSTKRGNIFAIDSKNGGLIWKKKLSSPIRSSPVAKAGIVVVSTVNSKTYALSAKTGKIKWEHEAGEESTKLVSSPAPLIVKDKIIVTYSSGEVFALNFRDGEEVWSAITSPERITQLLPTNNDIYLTPVYHQGILLVVSADGTIFALDAETGEEIWQFKEKSIAHAPWPVANYLFAVSRFGELFAISFTDGSVIWEKSLENKETIDEDDLIFSPPVLASSEIFVADNDGHLRAYSPKDGKVKYTTDIDDNIMQQPVIADGKMYFISNNSNLVVLH